MRDLKDVKRNVINATLLVIDNNLSFALECSVSDSAISAILNQNGRPVAFFSRSLQGGELYYLAASFDFLNKTITTGE